MVHHTQDYLSKMSSGVFVVDVIVTLLLSAYLLFHYGDWMRHRVAVTLAVLIAWYFSFLIIFVLPLDVSSTCYRQCLDEEKNKTAEALAEWHKMNDLHRSEDDNNSSSSSNNNSSSSANVTAPVAAQLSLAPMCHPPYSILPDDVLPNLWRVVYWSSQLLTWLVLPLMQSYTTVSQI